MDTLPLAQQRCRHHAEREAVGLCPACGGSFCRECLTEHDDQVLCAACLRKQARAETPKKTRSYPVLVHSLQALVGLLLLWLFFCWAGRLLLSLPDTFHEGKVWQEMVTP